MRSYKEILQESIIRNDNARLAISLGIITNQEYQEFLEDVVNKTIKEIKEVTKFRIEKGN